MPCTRILIELLRTHLWRVVTSDVIPISGSVEGKSIEGFVAGLLTLQITYPMRDGLDSSLQVQSAIACIICAPRALSRNPFSFCFVLMIPLVKTFGNKWLQPCQDSGFPVLKRKAAAFDIRIPNSHCPYACTSSPG